MRFRLSLLPLRGVPEPANPAAVVAVSLSRDLSLFPLPPPFFFFFFTALLFLDDCCSPHLVTQLTFGKSSATIHVRTTKATPTTKWGGGGRGRGGKNWFPHLFTTSSIPLPDTRFPHPPPLLPATPWTASIIKENTRLHGFQLRNFQVFVQRTLCAWKKSPSVC